MVPTPWLEELNPMAPTPRILLLDVKADRGSVIKKSLLEMDGWHSRAGGGWIGELEI